ncbi:sodium:solute symporter family transporter, partial [Escherichia coli]|uniref:sodium:solute symporter family transporter n=1 Tax=Escherichia coli TaxID=562 RepID=UPI003CED0A65
MALETILGVPMMYAIIGLALFAVIYSLYGGLSAVAWTDVVQVFFLILGGLFTTVLAVSYIGG